jgi:hypothetical protein
MVLMRVEQEEAAAAVVQAHCTHRDMASACGMWYHEYPDSWWTWKARQQ